MTQGNDKTDVETQLGVKVAEDPTARIMEAGINTADPTPVAPISPLGETKPGRSPVEYEDRKVALTPAEYAAAKEQWLSDSFPLQDQVLQVLPNREGRPKGVGPAALIVAGSILFGVGLYLGALAQALFSYVS